MDKCCARHVVAARAAVTVAGPVNEKDRVNVPIQRWIDLPAAFSCLQARAATCHIPMLGQREYLISADRRLPEVQETVSASIVHVLESMGPAVGCGNTRRDRRAATLW